MVRRFLQWLCMACLAALLAFSFAHFLSHFNPPPISAYASDVENRISVQPYVPAQVSPIIGSSGDILLSTTPGNIDIAPAVAYNGPAHEFLFVYSSNSDVYAQRYSDEGVPLGEPILVFDNPFHVATSPAVAYSLTEDRYLVAWYDNRQQGQDIYGRFVDADGQVMGNDFSIFVGDGDQLFPRLAYDGSAFLVVWEDALVDPEEAIRARFVMDDGTVSNKTITIAAGADATRRRIPQVAYDELSSEFLVVYVFSDGPSQEIWARRVQPNGNLPGDEFTISACLDSWSPQVISSPWDTHSAFLVAWNCNVANQSVGMVAAFQAGADEQPLLPASVFVDDTSAANQRSLAIARSPLTGNILVAWEDERNMVVSDYDIYARLFSSQLEPLGNTFPLNQHAGAQGNHALASSQDPDVFLAIWEDLRLPSDPDIFGQRISTSGVLQWYEFNISVEPGAQGRPAVVYGGGQYLTVWQSQLDGRWSIFARRLSNRGEPLESPWVIETDFHNNMHPTLAYNPQTNSFLAAWEDDLGGIEGARIPAAGTAVARFSVFDSDGGFTPFVSYEPDDDQFMLLWGEADGVYCRQLAWDGIPLGAQSLLLYASNAGAFHLDAAWNPAESSHQVVIGEEVNGQEEVVAALVDTSCTRRAMAALDPGDHQPRLHPAIAFDNQNNQFLVAYSYLNSSGDADLRGRLMDDSGGLLGDELDLRSLPADAPQTNPDLAFSPSAGRYYMIWSEDRGDAPGQDLYGLWLNPDASPAAAVLPFFSFSGNQDYPALAYDLDTDQGLVVWEDYRRSQQGDIYARLGSVDTQPPTAAFLRLPTVARVGSTFLLNANLSHDNLTSPGALAVRWDLDSDGVYDTPWSFDKVITRTVNLPGVFSVTLEVRDLMWLTDTVSLPVRTVLAPTNTPPHAALEIDPAVVDAGAAFTLDASASSDAQTPAGSLLVTWDLDGDGAFDTAPSVNKTYIHNFTAAGEHTIHVQVQDAGLLTDIAQATVLIQPLPPVRLEIFPQDVVVAIGSQVQFSAAAYDQYNNLMTNPAVTWSLNDARAGTITAEGLFTPGEADGLFTDVVAAASGPASDEATVRIVWPFSLYLPLSFCTR